MNFKLLLLLFCLIYFPIHSQNKIEKSEWEKIIPFETSKAELENYFGKPYLETPPLSIYDIKAGRIFVTFKNEKNSGIGEYHCEIPLNTVISFDIRFAERIPIENFDWNLNKFEKFLQDDGFYIYSYLKQGISFSVYSDRKKLVSQIRYDPTLKNIERKCVKKENKLIVPNVIFKM